MNSNKPAHVFKPYERISKIRLQRVLLCHDRVVLLKINTLTVKYISIYKKLM